MRDACPEPAEPVPKVRIGTAGWAVPRLLAANFPAEGAGLARYAARFDAVEINSTFYRSHRAATYARWVALTPSTFRFSVKLPRTITHEARLQGTEPLLSAFARETASLGERLGPVLVQLPPSLVFDAGRADGFFRALRAVWPGPAVCEPRHASWFTAEAEELLAGSRIGRVAADPAPHPGAGTPGGWSGVAYWRLHGTPRMYRSFYDEEALHALAALLRTRSEGETWCVFDNTASGAATANALALSDLMTDQQIPHR